MPTIPTRFLLCLFALGGSAGAADPASRTAAPPTSLTILRARIATMQKADPQVWTTFDRDRDGKVSEVEVLAALAGNPAWFRARFTAEFATIDRNHDNALSVAELQALADASPNDGYRLEVDERRRSTRDRFGPGTGGQGGADIGVSGGGGGEAFVAHLNQQAYIQDYDVVQGQYMPVVGTLTTGTALSVGNVIITIRRVRR